MSLLLLFRGGGVSPPVPPALIQGGAGWAEWNPGGSQSEKRKHDEAVQDAFDAFAAIAPKRAVALMPSPVIDMAELERISAAIDELAARRQGLEARASLARYQSEVARYQHWQREQEAIAADDDDVIEAFTNHRRRGLLMVVEALKGMFVRDDDA